MPHEGYREGEHPVYGTCDRCGLSVRLDRSDLLAEHVTSCRGVDLSPRQLVILRLAAEGWTDNEIAAKIMFSRDTVRDELAAMFGKLKAENRAHLVAIAFRRRLLT